jgi:hypothetical protein
MTSFSSQAIARERLFSARQLDFWSLALCSCLLTLLCHSIANPPQPSATKSDTVAQQSATASTQSRNSPSFKLFTLASSKPEIEDDEESDV